MGSTQGGRATAERLEASDPKGRRLDVAGGAAPEALHREFEALGLSPYEARVVLALLHLGSASAAQLARASKVPRTSTYQILEELHVKGLAERLAGPGPAVWTARGHEEVVGLLEAAEEERLRQHKARASRMREMLAEAFPEPVENPLPFVHVIHDPARVEVLYLQMVADARQELLVFNRPPYSTTIGNPNPTIIEAAQRLHCRVLYQEMQAGDADSEAWHREMDAYHEAGAEGRVVDELPIKLAVFDRKAALLTLTDPNLPNIGFPTVLLFEHPGFAVVQTAAFNELWETGRPFVRSAGIRRRSARAKGTAART